MAATLVLVSIETSTAAATTYYVRSSGDDSRDGLSPETALASMRSAARLLGQTDTAVGNVLSQSGAEGLLLKGVHAARVRNNVIVSNRESGILLRDAAETSVVNNLVYANGDDGISIG